MLSMKTCWERHVSSDTTGSMNSGGHQRGKACVSVQPAVAQGSFRVHMRYAVFRYGDFFECLRGAKEASFAPPSTNDTHSVITLGHAATNGYSAWTPSVHTKDDCCRELEPVSFVAVQRGCPHLLQNNFTRIALTPSAKALAPSSPNSLSPRKSVVIDWLALLCFDEPTPHLNLSAMATRRVRFADPIGCVRDKVCSAGVPPRRYCSTPC